MGEVKTTVDVHDELLLRAKRHAKETGQSLRGVIEEGLRLVLEKPRKPATGCQICVWGTRTDRTRSRSTRGPSCENSSTASGALKMIAVDTNILVYALRFDSPHNDAAFALLRELSSGSQPWAIPWPCCFEFLVCQRIGASGERLRAHPSRHGASSRRGLHRRRVARSARPMGSWRRCRRS